MAKIFDKTFIRDLYIGLLILTVTFFAQITGWLISRHTNKKDLTINRQIELTDRLSLNTEDFLYLWKVQIQLSYADINFSAIAHEFSLNGGRIALEDSKLINPELDLIIQDSLMKKYPMLVTKAMETGHSAASLRATLRHIKLSFKEERIQLNCDSLNQLLLMPGSWEYLENNFVKKKLEVLRFNERFAIYENTVKAKTDELLKLMVNEYSN